MDGVTEGLSFCYIYEKWFLKLDGKKTFSFMESQLSIHFIFMFYKDIKMLAIEREVKLTNRLIS
jgi:hypothetical protein